ncbi:MAG: hypothetical protein AB7N24_08835 [Dehalococcoidia bacterium]
MVGGLAVAAVALASAIGTFFLLGGGGDADSRSAADAADAARSPAAATQKPGSSATAPPPGSTVDLVPAAAVPTNTASPSATIALATATQAPQAPTATIPLPTATYPLPTATSPPPIATTAPTQASAETCYPVTVVNTSTCIMGTGTSPKGIDLSCVPPGVFVGLSTGDTRFEYWSADGATLAAPNEGTTTFKMPANPVTVTLACGS